MSVRPSGLGLRGVGLLAGLSSGELDQLAQQCRWQRFSSGQHVVSRAAADQDFYMIVSGAVRITAFSAAGKQVTFRELKAGECFGELAAIDGRTRSATVQALDDAVLASLRPALFMGLLHKHPSICERLLNHLVALIRDLSERWFDLSTLGVPNRVHAEILRLAREAGVRDDSARLHPAPKHADLAARVCTSREQVTRELSAMAKQGLIKRVDRALVVPEVARLERIVAEVRRSV